MNDHNLTTLSKLLKLSFYHELSYGKIIDFRKILVRDKIVFSANLCKIQAIVSRAERVEVTDSSYGNVE